jgi:hypothetical protein
MSFLAKRYFRPEELHSEEWAMLVKRRTNRTAAAALFKVTTSRMAEELLAIDEANATFCEGNYRDGSWVHTNSQCEDNVNFRKVMVPSDYFTVRVEPAPSRTLASK